MDDYGNYKNVKEVDLFSKEEYFETESLLLQEPESNTVLMIRILKVAIPNILSNFVFYLQSGIQRHDPNRLHIAGYDQHLFCCPA